MLSATVFFAEFLGSSLNRSCGKLMRKSRGSLALRGKCSGESAQQLNAHALEWVDGMAMTNAAPIAPETANVIPFPARPAHFRGPAIARWHASA
jgi:hypothetical protein